MFRRVNALALCSKQQLQHYSWIPQTYTVQYKIYNGNIKKTCYSGKNFGFDNGTCTLFWQKTCLKKVINHEIIEVTNSKSTDKY